MFLKEFKGFLFTENEMLYAHGLILRVNAAIRNAAHNTKSTLWPDMLRLGSQKHVEIRFVLHLQKNNPDLKMFLKPSSDFE